jgi:hypothetical protein
MYHLMNRDRFLGCRIVQFINLHGFFKNLSRFKFLKVFFFFFSYGFIRAPRLLLAVFTSDFHFFSLFSVCGGDRSLSKLDFSV